MSVVTPTKEDGTNYTFADGKVISYEVVATGYYINLGGNPWISQLEPYIPDKTKTYEENAIAQIKQICVPATPAQV